MSGVLVKVKKIQKNNLLLNMCVYIYIYIYSVTKYITKYVDTYICFFIFFIYFLPYRCVDDYYLTAILTSSIYIFGLV